MNRKNQHRDPKIQALAVIFGIFLLGPALVFAKDDGPRVRVKKAGKPGILVSVELARTPAEQQRGLMFRKELGTNAGMLFIFTDDRVRTFWMKNTLISLDMIFIDREMRIVGIVERATPQTLEPRYVPSPSRYVLEVNGGFCATRGIGAGDQVDFQGF